MFQCRDLCSTASLNRLAARDAAEEEAFLKHGASMAAQEAASWLKMRHSRLVILCAPSGTLNIHLPRYVRISALQHQACAQHVKAAHKCRL